MESKGDCPVEEIRTEAPQCPFIQRGPPAGSPGARAGILPWLGNVRTSASLQQPVPIQKISSGALAPFLIFQVARPLPLRKPLHLGPLTAASHPKLYNICGMDSRRSLGLHSLSHPALKLPSLVCPSFTAVGILGNFCPLTLPTLNKCQRVTLHFATV